MLLIDALPAVNATLNATSALFLAAGFGFIRAKRVTLHKVCMLAAVATSTLFLVSYGVYHAVHGVTRFPGTGWVRTGYLALLGSHTALAALVVPLVLVTLWQALQGNFSRHKRIARWTLPVWMYVSVTGVIVYWILYHLVPVS